MGTRGSQDKVRQKFERDFSRVFGPLKSFNLAAENVAGIFADEIGKHVQPLIQWFGLLMEAFAGQTVERWKGQASCCETEEDRWRLYPESTSLSTGEGIAACKKSPPLHLLLLLIQAATGSNVSL